MCNWLVIALQKEATRRRFAPDDMVRYWTDNRKGTGKGVVLTPMFARGRILDYDQSSRQYRVWSDKEQTEIMVHPRNLVPESISRSQTSDPVSNQQMQGQEMSEPVLV